LLSVAQTLAASRRVDRRATALLATPVSPATKQRFVIAFSSARGLRAAGRPTRIAGSRRHGRSVAFAAQLALALTLASLCGPGATAVHAQAPIVVGRFERVASAGGRVAVAVVVERPGVAPRTVALRVVDGPCTEDVGGLESLAVLSCRDRLFELVQRGLRIEVIESTADDRRRRIRRHAVLRARAGWVVVPRCRAVADDPRACLPSH